ncbi:MAG: laccase domain-containing protein [Candidatus Omnitrophica bacterium]|nr:laccase domain-containing protein [Candidatus Omnitrophota bacterium]
MKRLFLACLGVVLAGVGVAGLVLPFLPGLALIFVGLSFIAPELAEKLKRKILRRWMKREVFLLKERRRGGVTAGFTTRHFPLVLSQTDDLLDPFHQELFKKDLRRNLRSLKGGGAKGGWERFVFLDQPHGDRVAVIEDSAKYEAPGFYRLFDADGVVTPIGGLALLALTADCLPIFFYGAGGEPLDSARGKLRRTSWIGLVHAGWRGTKSRIAQKAFRLLLEKSGCAPSDVRIAFGPCIRKEHYEVGGEFLDYFPERSLRRKGGRLYFDLAGENRRQLVEAGVLERHISDLGICTVDENEDFYSFRKEKALAGRMVSFTLKFA